MKWPGIVNLFLLYSLTACSYLPEMAPLVSYRSELAKTPTQERALLAFVPVSPAADVELNLVVRKIGTDRRFMIRLNPTFARPRRWTRADSAAPDTLRYRGLVNLKAAIFALPPGRYSTLYKQYHIPFVRENGNGIRGLRPDTFELAAGRIASLGFLQSEFSSTWLEGNRVHLRGVGSDIDSILSNSRDSMVSRMPIDRTPLRLDDSPELWPCL